MGNRPAANSPGQSKEHCVSNSPNVYCIEAKVRVDKGPSGKLSSVIPWRRDDVKYTQNEIFFDFVESINAVFDRSITV